jgi:hypothetical protein
LKIMHPDLECYSLPFMHSIVVFTASRGTWSHESTPWS